MANFAEEAAGYHDAKLTEDHKPENKAERSRIEKAGGAIATKSVLFLNYFLHQNSLNFRAFIGSFGNDQSVGIVARFAAQLPPKTFHFWLSPVHSATFGHTIRTPINMWSVNLEIYKMGKNLMMPKKIVKVQWFKTNKPYTNWIDLVKMHYLLIWALGLTNSN